MKRAFRWPISLSGVVLVVGWLGVLVFGRAQMGRLLVQAGNPDNGITVTLQTDGAPAVGGVATLTFTATPLLDAPDLTVQWFVPAGVEVLGEAVQSFGAVPAGQTVTAQRQVRFTAEGTHQVVAAATFHWGDVAQFGASGVLFFSTGPDASRVSAQDPADRGWSYRAEPGEVTVSVAQDLSVPRALNGDPCFDVVGTVMREERRATPTGFTAPTLVPVRYAEIEVREEDIIFDDSYGQRPLNSDGSFVFHFCDDDGLFDDELEIYVRLHGEMDDVAEVEDQPTLEWFAVDSTVYYINTDPVDSEGGTIVFNWVLNEQHSAVWNILDAIYEAREFFAVSGGGRTTDLTVHWERGEGEGTSHYNTFSGAIYIADSAADPDEWDDAVIMHEWGHFVDDHYSCDENPGGTHVLFGLYDPELAFGEGYPDYFQGAVRAWRGDSFSQFYLDVNPGSVLSVNMETWDTMGVTQRSIQSEMAVAAALWDLMDNANDANAQGPDTVSWGHPLIQSVYISEEFEDADNCNWDTFERAWRATGKPVDGPTAQAIVKNVNETELTLLARQRSPSGQGAAPEAAQATTALPGESDWWDKLLFVVDNSASMAGDKFAGVKTVLDEAVNDLGQAPQGTEFSLYTFNNTSSASPLLSGKFFPEDITPVIAGLSTIGAADSVCRVDAFRALAQALDKRFGVDAWLLTDGDTTTVAPSVEGMKQILRDKQVRASFALLGVCPTLTGETAPDEPGQPQESAILLRGLARSYLGLAADPTPGGIVPYLLTAIASGGQFLFVHPSQAGLAGDILRAQMTHSAGAGRWSDYVSNTPTYRYDTLASWEYQWIEATNQIPSVAGDTSLIVSLPQPLPFFAAGPYSTVRAYQDGYLVFGDFGAVVRENVQLPNPALPNNAMYPFWDDLSVPVPPALQSPQFGGSFGQIYTGQQGEWFVIEYRGFKRNLSDPGVTFEALFNLTTGEIRFQYKDVPGGAGSATIGLENAAGNDAVPISFNDINGAKNNMGYKFVPAPPQPSKTYTVAVDSLMQGVGFLLTGYSGSFSPLVVRDPNGVEVNCAAQGVLCLNLAGTRVQYVQTNVNGRTGVWTATVYAGNLGTSTFSFSSMAAGLLAVEGRGDYTPFSGEGARLLIGLGQSVDGNVLTGWFRRPDNRPFGTTCMLYDDGAHGDERAGDGIFGSDPCMPGAGTGYLWVSGTLNGEPFVRSDPRPYTFQPLKLSGAAEAANMGEATNLTFRIENTDAFEHCFDLSLRVPDGWTFNLPHTAVCMGAQSSVDIPVTVWMGNSGQTNTLPSGSSGLVTLAAVENEKGSMSDSVSTLMTRRRPPTVVDIFVPVDYLRPNGDTVMLEVTVFDEQGAAVADGTPVQFSASTGNIAPATGYTQGGLLYVTYTSGAQTGQATVTATAGSVQATATINIASGPVPEQFTLTTSAGTLPADGQSTATLVATAKDRWNTPLANQTVRIGTGDDAETGTINGGEIITGTTDANGQFTATYTSGTVGTTVVIQAELLIESNGAYTVTHSAQQSIRLLTGAASRVFLPLLYR